MVASIGTQGSQLNGMAKLKMSDQLAMSSEALRQRDLRRAERRSLDREIDRRALSDTGMLIREYAQIGGDRDIAPGLSVDLKPRNMLQHMIVHQTAVAYTLAMLGGESEFMGQTRRAGFLLREHRAGADGKH